MKNRIMLKSEVCKSFWFLLIVNVVILFVASWLMPMRYEELDDTTQLLFASGAYTGTPDAHLVFVNYIYGLLLTHLYGSISGVEWYTVCFLLIHIIGSSIIMWKLVNVGIETIWKVCGCLFLYLMELQFILNLQFTTTSALLATASIMLFVGGTRLQQYVSIVLFVIAGLVRFESAFLVLGVTAPTILFYWFTQKDKIKILLLLSLFALLPIIGVVIDKKIYNQDVEWKTYREYNFYRGSISDNPNSLRMQEIDTFVDYADFVMFRDVFPNIGVVNNEKARLIYEYVKAVPFLDKVKNIYLRSQNPINLRNYQVTLTVFLIITIFIVVVLKEKRKIYLIVATSSMFFLLLSYICLDSMLKQRVFWTAMFPYVFILLYGFSNLKDKQMKRVALAAFLTMFVFGTVDLVNRRIMKNISFDKSAITTVDILKQAKPLLKEHERIIAYSNGIVIEALSPYSISEFYRNNPYTIINWTSTIPFNKGRMDSYLDIVDKNILVADENFYTIENLPLIQKNILLHYGIHTKIETVAISGSIHLIRFISVAEQE